MPSPQLLVVIIALILGNVGVRAGELRDVGVIWADEFDGPSGTTPDQSKWSYHIGDGTGQGLPGWGNQELEYYTDQNAVMDGEGNLVITATPDGAAAYSCYYGVCQFTSGRLFTNCKFTHRYGRFEARLKTPTGQGCWPGFWMLGDDYNNVGWPDSGEIDIMELKGSNPSTVMGTIHGPGYSGSAGITDSYTLPNGASFADDFHILAVEWEPNTITWYVDDVAYRTRTPADLNGNPWVFDHPFYFLFSFAVGGNFDGNPGPNTVFPQYFTFDYVRVYDAGGNYTVPPTPPTPPTQSTVTAGPTQSTENPPTTSRPSGNRDAFSDIEAESADQQKGTTIEDCSDAGGGQDVSQISDGDVLVYRNVDFGSGASGVQIRFASDVTPGISGTMSLHLDSSDNQYFALFGLGYTGGWQQWQTEVGGVSPLPAGIHDLYITFQCSSTESFASLNWFVFTA